jgi:hypothetical protein
VAGHNRRPTTLAATSPGGGQPGAGPFPHQIALELGQGSEQGTQRHVQQASEAGRTPGEQGQAHALLVKSARDSDWQATRQAIGELTRKLLVVHRLLAAKERLAKREPPTERP